MPLSLRGSELGQAYVALADWWRGLDEGEVEPLRQFLAVETLRRWNRVVLKVARADG